MRDASKIKNLAESFY